MEQFGLAMWSPKQMKEHYEAVEKHLNIEPAKDEVQGGSAKFFGKGLKAHGHTMRPLSRNAPRCCGSGVCCFGCPTNAKQSMQLNYIPLALQAGAKLYANCQAKKISYKRWHATKVTGQFHHPDTKKKGPYIKVNAKIIVAACGARPW